MWSGYRRDDNRSSSRDRPYDEHLGKTSTRATIRVVRAHYRERYDTDEQETQRKSTGLSVFRAQ